MYEPSAACHSHRRAGSKRDENPREPAPLATGGPTTGSAPARVGLIGWCDRRKLAASRSTWKRATGARSARSVLTSLPREGWVWVGRFNARASSRSSVQSPLGGSGREGQGDAGCRREGARARRSDFNARKGLKRGWRLAHGSAREALGELDRRSTVMRGVRSTLRIDGSWVREPRRRSPDRGMQPRWLGARRYTWHGTSVPCVCRREKPNPEPWWSEL